MKRKRGLKTGAKVDLPLPENENVGAETMKPPLIENESPAHDQIAVLAYSYWEARGYQGGSPEEDWFRAEIELCRQQPAGKA